MLETGDTDYKDYITGLNFAWWQRATVQLKGLKTTGVLKMFAGCACVLPVYN